MRRVRSDPVQDRVTSCALADFRLDLCAVDLSSSLDPVKPIG
jgi:hypothetical protein